MATPLANEPASARSPKRRHKWLWRSLIVLILIGVSVGAWVTYRRYTDPEHIRASAESYLRRLVQGPVTVGSAGFSWFGGIRIYDVTVTPPARVGFSAPDWDDPIFSCREVRLTPDVFASRFDRLTIKSLTAVEPSCLIIRHAEDGRTNLAGLFESLSSVTAESYAVLPTVELRDARVQVVDRAGERDRVVEDLRMTVRARPSRRNSSVYDIVWQGGGTRLAHGYSQVDLTTGRVKNVHGGLPWMSIEAVMIAVNAQFDATGTWSDLLGLDGIVRADDYYLGGVDEPDRPRSVTIELDNASLSIPIDEHERPLPPDQRFLRFEQVFGTAKLTSDGLDADFAGTFHEGQCHVSAKVRAGADRLRLATLQDVDFEARITLNDFRLPQARAGAPPQDLRFIHRWRPIRFFYNDFDPHGYADLDVEVKKRAGADQPFVVRKVVLTVEGGDASYRLFPYRARNVTGTIEFTSEGVLVKNVRGEHDGGVVTVDGWLAEANDCAAAEFSVRGLGIPIDDALVDALPTGYRGIRELLQPDGSIDVLVDLTRSACTDHTPARWTFQTTVSFDDLSATFTPFPYPVAHLAGMITADRKRIEVDRVTGRAGDGQVQMGGTLEFDGKRLSNVDLNVQGQDIALDEQFLSTLPEPIQERALPFLPGGQLDLQVSVGFDPHVAKPTHRTEVLLKDAQIEHPKFPARISDVTGRLVLTPTEIALQDIAGAYRGGTIHARGRIDCTDPPRKTHLTIRCQDLVIDEALRAAAPAKLKKAIDTWRIEGPVTAELSVRHDPIGDSGALAVDATTWVNGSTVQHKRFPLPFENVRGEISFDQLGVHATGIEARYGDADVRVDFDTRDSEAGEEGTIRLTVEGATLDSSLRDVMPDDVRNAWDELGLAGRVDLYLDRFDYQRPAAGGAAAWQVEGRANLHDVDLLGVAGVRKISGTLSGKGMLADPRGGTALSGVIDLSAMRLFGRRVTAVTGPWAYAQIVEGKGQFSLPDLTGEIYGGSLKGEVGVVLDRQDTRYDLRTIIHQMDLEPFLNADLSSRQGDAKRVNAKGLVDIRMHLSGNVGDPGSRQGRGHVEISKGNMYRLPIMLAILHVIDLSVPDEGVFHDAEARFFLMGNRLELQDIGLQGNILALKGYGAISVPDRGLDLHLVNVTPHQWARLPALTDFMEGALGEIVELHVTGPLWQPTVTPRPLPSIRGELKRLFQKKKPRNLRPVEP